MYIYAEIATSGVNNWAILRDWHGGVLTKSVISYPILELASIFWYHWMCNIQEGTIHMLTYSYTERNQPQRIKMRATPTFLVCLSPRVKCTQHPVWCRSLTFMLCSLYPVYLGWIYCDKYCPVMPNLWKVQYGPGSTVAHKYIYDIVCTSPLYIAELIRKDLYQLR